MTAKGSLVDRDGRLKSSWVAALREQSARFATLSTKPEAFELIRELLETLMDLLGQSQSADQTVRAVAANTGQLTALLSNLQQRLALGSPEVLLLLLSARSMLGEMVTPTDFPAGNGGEDAELEQAARLLGRLGVLFFESAMQPSVDPRRAPDLVNLDYALLYEQTRRLAITDSLTGLYNYGYFLDRLAEERARAERYERLLSLILIDIDWFKLYNDTNGHPAGNEVLTQLAEVLSDEAREVDIVARFGGEEFVVIVPEANRKDVHAIADRMRSRIARTTFKHCETQPEGKLTISVGVATFPIDASSSEGLLQIADQSLYSAKRSGRNRVVPYTPRTFATIRYRPRREVRRVSLVGSFNNWDTEADVMSLQEDGAYLSQVALIPGNYRYKFVLDDVEWVAAPDAQVEPDHFGGENNVLHIEQQSLDM